MTRPVPPPLEVQAPLCGVCGGEVEHDYGSWSCSDCGAQWPDENVGDAKGTWIDWTAEQCPSIDGRFLPGGRWVVGNPSSELYRCLLAVGHGFMHEFSDGWGVHRAWPLDDSATPQQLAQVQS